jgi:nicotinamidase-related amidase
MLNRHLVLVDIQNDFVLPPNHGTLMPQGGSLYVNGAEKDGDRLAVMIDKNPRGFADIHATMDSHFRIHIAHKHSWINSKGEHPQDFTPITLADVDNGVWRARRPGFQKWYRHYVATLEANASQRSVPTARDTLTIWPDHCLVSTVGHALYQPLADALAKWELTNYGYVDFVTKGLNILSEHYSAIKADVPVEAVPDSILKVDDDPSTQLNTRFIQTLEEADEVWFAGEALSHCVASTFYDVADNFSNADYIRKLVFIEDASSPVEVIVNGVNIYQEFADNFLRDMKARGMRTARTTDL